MLHAFNAPEHPVMSVKTVDANVAILLHLVGEKKSLLHTSRLVALT
jgi:hypothetical protein